MELIRLDKYISSQTTLSRNDVKALVRRGAVSVDGKPVKSSDVRIDAENASVSVNGKEILYRRNIYIMLNKPDGYVCSTRDGRSPIATELIPEELRLKGIFPAGRLDKDSKGFVLLTNDGELAHRMLSPKKHIAKYYLVKLAQPFENEYTAAFADKIELDDGHICLPARAERLENSPNYAIVELFEGKYHQVRRMFAACGNRVEELFRFRLGNLSLPHDLGAGEHLEIMPKDVDEILVSPDFYGVKAALETAFSSYLINNNL